MVPDIVPFLWRRWTGTKLRATVPLHGGHSWIDRYWSGLKQQAQEKRSNHGTPQKYLHLKWYIPISKASSNSFRLRSWLLLAKSTRALTARGTKGRVTTARRRLNWLRVSASVRMSSQPVEIIAASLTPLNYQIYATVPNTAKTIWKIVTNLMHNPWEDSLQGWVLHRRKSNAQPQLHFWNHPEQQQSISRMSHRLPGRLKH